MTLKKLARIIPSQKVDMGGHIIDQPLPNRYYAQVDPFLLIHHAQWTYPGGQRPQDVGVGAHPHRGFSPVTFVFQGDVRHQDSFGNDTIIKAGGTQWMHAGKGITHSERPSKELAEKGGMQEFIQFWINTPAEYKMEVPHYLPLSKEETPSFSGEGYEISVVAGNYNGIDGPAKTFSPMILLRGEVQKASQVTFDLPANYNTVMYLLNGKGKVNDIEVRGKDLVVFKNEGTKINFHISEASQFILLSGEPLNEKIKSYGPFVMNDQTEILQALRDSQMGKMGVLIEEFD